MDDKADGRVAIADKGLAGERAIGGAGENMYVAGVFHGIHVTEQQLSNELQLAVERWDWRAPRADRFDVALAADVLYEHRNVEPLLARLRELAPVAYVGLAGRPYEAAFLREAGEAGTVTEIAERVVSLR